MWNIGGGYIMNIKKMLYAQKELDDIWMKRANLTEYPLEMTITAIQILVS